MKAAILIISDRCYHGEATDKTAPILSARLKSAGIEVVEVALAPDEIIPIKQELIRLSDQVGADMVISSGGTGLGPRDVTPEATEAILDRRAPGLAEAMRMGSLAHTPYAMLSRGTAGLRGRTLIVNLPGSSNGARECLDIILPVLKHAFAMIQGGGHGSEATGDGGPTIQTK